MRVVCFEASNTKTSVAGTPLARARLRIGSLTPGSVKGLYSLKSGLMNTGMIAMAMARKTTLIPAAHSHQVLWARRIAAYTPITARPPRTTPSSNPLPSSPSQEPKPWLERP